MKSEMVTNGVLVGPREQMEGLSRIMGWPLESLRPAGVSHQQDGAGSKRDDLGANKQSARK